MKRALLIAAVLLLAFATTFMIVRWRQQVDQLLRFDLVAKAATLIPLHEGEPVTDQLSLILSAEGSDDWPTGPDLRFGEDSLANKQRWVDILYPGMTIVSQSGSSRGSVGTNGILSTATVTVETPEGESTSVFIIVITPTGGVPRGTAVRIDAAEPYRSWSSTGEQTQETDFLGRSVVTGFRETIEFGPQSGLPE